MIFGESTNSDTLNFDLKKKVLIYFPSESNTP